MNSVEFLKNRLSVLFNEFDIQSIRYELIENRKIHLIEVIPDVLLRNEDFAIANLDLDDEFCYLYPSEELIFLSAKSLNKVVNPIFELSNLDVLFSIENIYDNYKIPSEAFNAYDIKDFVNFINSLKSSADIEIHSHIDEYVDLNIFNKLTKEAGDENYALAA